MTTLIFPQTSELLEQLLQEETLQPKLEELREYDSDTYEHSLRVAELSIELGYENGFSAGEIYYLGRGGLLHDLGKKEIPSEVLLKNGAFTPQERRITNGHARLGRLEAEPTEDEVVQYIIVACHEWNRQNSYPRNGQDRRTGSRGTERRKTNPLGEKLSQIVALADMYDALSNQRCYKESWSRERTEETLRNDYLGNPLYIEQVLF